MMKMGRMGMGHGEGSRFGSSFAGLGRGGPGRGEMLHGFFQEFFAENPDCADKAARYLVAQMREEGLSDDEIREIHYHKHGRGPLFDLDIDAILG